nr:endonuclease/exonuclease/phosphatase family protein [uncultured Cetobacterium sp.]
MKKLFFTTIYLFLFIFNFSFSSNDIPTEATIATFNTLRLGKNKKNYNYLAKAIQPFDLIGLTEVMDKRGLYELLKVLDKISNEKWGYHISPYPVGTDTYKEYYAFIYKKDKVKFLSDSGFYPDYNNNFIREPYGANFKIGNFDFTYVLIHSIYGKKISQRQFEASKLNDVYEHFQNLDLKENDILIGGDFNLPANDIGFSKFLKNTDKIIYTIDPNIKTTLGTKGFANSYDNIFISKIYTNEFKGNSGALDITINGNFNYLRKEVSDHIPVFIFVNTDKDDD